MTWRYRQTGQPVAEGERTVLLQGGRFYVRTGVLAVSVDDPANQQISYRLREVFDDTAPVNHPPTAGSVTTKLEIKL